MDISENTAYTSDGIPRILPHKAKFNLQKILSK